MSTVLVIAPHPDDEILGCGGTMCRMIRDGHTVKVAIVTKGTPLFPETQVEQVRSEARQANNFIGAELVFLDLPVTTLHLIPEAKLNQTFDVLIQKTAPDIVFLPFRTDRHEDHRQVFDAVMVATRPDGRRHNVKRIACYETVSETHWTAPGIENGFEPNWYVDIEATLDEKINAMKLYASQLSEGIPARSVEAIEALARFRGSIVGMKAAEAFLVIRELWEPGEI